MNTSIVLAQIVGISFIILGLSIVFNKKAMATIIGELTSNKSALWIVGFFTTMLGATLVTLNNTWSAGLPLLVTIVGWLTLLKGASLLLFPNTAASYYKKMNHGNIFLWAGLITFILGVLLLII
jgi:hypothetical protein